MTQTEHNKKTDNINLKNIEKKYFSAAVKSNIQFCGHRVLKKYNVGFKTKRCEMLSLSVVSWYSALTDRKKGDNYVI